MGSLKFSQQYGNNKISVNQNQKVVTLPVDVVEPGDKHFIGVVQEITEDGKFICSASELSDLIECIKGCNAEVGDEVIICLMQDGQYVVVARVGGDLGGGTGGGVLPEYGSTTDYIAGKVFAFAGNLTPAGCLLCDGSEVSRSEYWELFSVIGTLYGAGDGSTTFNLPNIESRTIIGESDSYALSTTGGEEKHTLTEAELPNLRGRAWFRNWTWGEGSQGSVFLSPEGIMEAEPGDTPGSDLLNYGNAQGGSTILKVEFGGDQPHNNMQPYIVMRYFITTGKADPASGINPADYVVEWGTTDGWHWEKWASGKAECWGSFTEVINITYAQDDNYYGYPSMVDYPFEFLEPPDVQAEAFDEYGNGWTSRMSNGTTTKTPRIFLIMTGSASDVSVTCSYAAKGKWKDSPASGGTETIAPTIAEKFEGIESDILNMKINKVLWSGDSWPKADQTITLSEAVSAQPNGIVLVWVQNDYDGTNTAKDYGWVFQLVPKSHVAMHNGKGVVCEGYNPTGNIHFIKYVYVSDTSIVGSAQNDVGSTNMNSGVVRNNQYTSLRYIIGV